MNLVEYREFAYEELEKWGLLEKGWTFVLSQAVVVAGFCDPSAKVIKLSQPIAEVETEAFNKDTILHEIAHALAGCHQAHNYVWKRWAVKVGCDPTATYKDRDAIDKLQLSKTKYVMCYGTKIVQTYLRKPNKRTILNIKEYWATGHKTETKGKLSIKVYNPAVHQVFL